MDEVSKQPSTWSYKTTKVLLFCFVFLIIVPLIGFSTQGENFETLLDPEKVHPSHMINLENNESEIITLYPGNIYTVFVKSTSNGINENEVLLIDVVSQNDLKPNSTSIFLSLFSENGETYDSVSSWIFTEEREVELQNSAGQKIWLVNESEVINSFAENDILIGSFLGCLTSICLMPVIILWFVINRPNPKALNIKLITNDSEERTSMDLLQFQERIPTSDELYRAIHGNNNMKKELKNKIEQELEQDSIPAPFTNRPDERNIQKITKNETKDNDFPNVIDFPEEKPNETWKEWDG